jgi:predicted MPP superfamily phosphohydrolase
MRTRYAAPLKALGVTAAVGAACVGYAAGYEVRSFRLRRVEIPVLPPGAKPMRVLQVSDIHMVNGQRKKQIWLRGLAALRPDLVINTGDNLSDPEAVPQTLDALGPLLDFPGAYVFGSNDYYGPTPKSPTRYLSAMLSGNHGMNNADGTARRGIVGAIHNPWTELRDGFDAAGWLDLTNRRGALKVNDLELELTGLDDPHIRRDRYAEVAGGPSADADVSFGVVHAPYLRVLDAFTADDYPLILAGHTHGGQLCVPFYGALVTNCDIDRKRVNGLSTHTAGGRRSFLHVSAGCGTNRYTPVRFACPPEATLLTLRPRART